MCIRDSSTGDLGAAGLVCSGTGPPVKAVGLPAADPLVLAVGGTNLDADRATGAYISESAWNTPAGGPVTASSSGVSSPAGPPGGIPEASGGGFSHLFSQPTYQDGVPGIEADRGVPDVAAARRVVHDSHPAGDGGDGGCRPARGSRPGRAWKCRRRR